MIKKTLDGTYKLAKRVVIAVIGGTILLLGFLMLVTPGPGLAAIGTGLAILAIEFAWARAWLSRVRRKISSAAGTARDNGIESRRK